MPRARASTAPSPGIPGTSGRAATARAANARPRGFATTAGWLAAAAGTGDGALVYVVGPLLDPLQVADLLVQAGAVRGMDLDINPSWPVFASFKPAAPDGLAAPSNGVSLAGTYRGSATFFDPAYARDFITMSARPLPGS
jgi:hypothetical protein